MNRDSTELKAKLLPQLDKKQYDSAVFNEGKQKAGMMDPGKKAVGTGVNAGGLGPEGDSECEHSDVSGGSWILISGEKQYNKKMTKMTNTGCSEWLGSVSVGQDRHGGRRDHGDRQAPEVVYHCRVGQRVSNFQTLLRVSRGDAPAEELLQGEALSQQCLQPRLLESRCQRRHQHPEPVPVGRPRELQLLGLEQEQAGGVQEKEGV